MYTGVSILRGAFQQTSQPEVPGFNLFHLCTSSLPELWLSVFMAHTFGVYTSTFQQQVISTSIIHQIWLSIKPCTIYLCCIGALKIFHKLSVFTISGSKMKKFIQFLVGHQTCHEATFPPRAPWLTKFTK